MSPLVIVVIALAVACGGVVLLFLKLRDARGERHAFATQVNELTERFRPVLDVEAERQRILTDLHSDRERVLTEMTRAEGGAQQTLQALDARHRAATGELQLLTTTIERLRAEQRALDEEATLQSFGFYKPRYDFATSEEFERRLDVIREQQKGMISNKTAAVGKIEWTVNGSKSEGKKQINQTIKLMLRAFNGESDAAIAKVNYKNIRVMEARIRKAHDTINSLVEVQQCVVASAYLALKLEELALVYEYEEKLQQERDEQKRIREQMREEERALREIEKVKQEAEKEEQRYAAALAKARAEVDHAAGAKQQKLLADIEALQLKLAEAQANKARAMSQAQMTRSGHVYIISNIGSFGEEVFKIGMTRRLEPQERVDELGDASVPFDFDVHAMIYCQDAPKLENALHREFHFRRVNRINERKEFFRVSIDEIAAAVHRLHGVIEVSKVAEAEQYRKTIALVEAERQGAPPQHSVGAAAPRVLLA